MAKRNGRVKVVQQRHPRVVETDPGPPFPFAWLLAATGLVIVAIAVVALVAPGQDGVDDPIDGGPDPVDEGPMVIIPLSEISDQVLAQLFQRPPEARDFKKLQQFVLTDELFVASQLVNDQ